MNNILSDTRDGLQAYKEHATDLRNRHAELQQSGKTHAAAMTAISLKRIEALLQSEDLTKTLAENN